MPPAVGGCTQRRCAACGHIGCCDDSPCATPPPTGAAAGHPIIRSFSPGEGWFWDYRATATARGPELTLPESRPLDETVPGPRGRVPADWAEILRNRAD